MIMTLYYISKLIVNLRVRKVNSILCILYRNKNQQKKQEDISGYNLATNFLILRLSILRDNQYLNF